MGTEAGSNLLLPEENQMIFSMIRQGHQKNTALALAVVKFYLSIQGEWVEKVVGAGTVTKDFSRKSYFIQIFDVQQRQKVWEEEVNIEVDYSNPVDLFHTFKGENDLVGLSFVDQGEATHFWDMVQNTMEKRSTSMKLAPGNKVIHENGFVVSSCGEEANSVNEDPMVEQMNNLRSFIQAAREANMLEEVAMLENNLRMLLLQDAQLEFRRQAVPLSATTEKEDDTIAAVKQQGKPVFSKMENFRTAFEEKKEKWKRPKIRREDIGAPRNPVHKTGMRLGAGGDLELVGNSDLLDPVLLKVFNVLGLDPGTMEAATLEKVKEVAAKNGVYETYKSNTSEREMKRDRRQMSRYQSKYPSAPSAPQSKSKQADPSRFARRVKRSLPSFPPPPPPKKKHESNDGPSEEDASATSLPPGRKPVSAGGDLLVDIRKGVSLK